MLLFVYNFLSCFNLVNGGADKSKFVPGNFNESRLTQQLHKSLLEVDAFLKSVQHNIHQNKTRLREQDYPDPNHGNVHYPVTDYKEIDTREIMNHLDMTTRDLFLDYNAPKIWWNGTSWKAEFTAPSFPATPPLYVYTSLHSLFPNWTGQPTPPKLPGFQRSKTLLPIGAITDTVITPQPSVPVITTKPGTESGNNNYQTDAESPKKTTALSPVILPEGEELPANIIKDLDLDSFLPKNKTDLRTPEDSKYYRLLTTTHWTRLPTFQRQRTDPAAKLTTIVPTTIQGTTPTAGTPPTASAEKSSTVTKVDVITEKPKQDISKEELYKLMNEKNIGYMEAFLLKFLYLVATKNETKRVVLYREPIITNMLDTRRLWYFGQPLIHVTYNLARIHHDQYDALQSYAGMMYFLLKGRKQTCEADVNSCIEYADTLYEAEEGEALFDRIKEFEQYPNNVTKTDRELMESMIEDFLVPATRLNTSDRRVKLFDCINRALILRYPYLPSKPFRRNGWFTGMWSGYKTSSLRMTFDLKVQTPRSNRKEFHKKISIKEVTFDGYRRTKINQRANPIDKHSEYNYERQLQRDRHMPYNMPTRRTVPTITVQKRFNVMTPAEPRVSTIRTTRTRPTPFIIPETRPTTDYKPSKFDGSYRVPHTTTMTTPIHYFHPIKRDNEKARDLEGRTISRLSIRRKQNKVKISTQSQTTSIYILNKRRSISQIRNKRRRFKYKKDVVRMIRDGSSYSDEEEALKVNLISALIHGNRTFDTAEVLDDAHWKDTEDMEKGLLRRASNVEVLAAWPHATNRKFLLKNRHGAVYNQI